MLTSAASRPESSARIGDSGISGSPRRGGTPTQCTGTASLPYEIRVMGPPAGRRDAAARSWRSPRARCAPPRPAPAPARASAAAMIVSGVCSRAQTMNGKPKRSRCAAVSVVIRSYCARREPVQAGRACSRVDSSPIRAFVPRSGCARISARRSSSRRLVDHRDHRRVQVADARERAPLPRGRGDPRRLLEHAAEARDERVAVEPAGFQRVHEAGRYPSRTRSIRRRGGCGPPRLAVVSAPCPG